jgi:hypothetical protein
MYLNQAMQMWGDKYEVQITMHHLAHLGEGRGHPAD